MGYGLGLGYRLGNGVGNQQGGLLNLIAALKSRVLADGGEIDSDTDLNNYVRMAKANGIYDSILFGMLGAYNIRTSGNTKYVTKGYDITPVEKLGSNLIVNGTFDTDISNWTNLNATSIWNNGTIEVTYNAAPSGVYQTFATAIGKRYRATASIISSTVFNTTTVLRVGNGSTPDAGLVDSTAFTASGTKSVEFIATGTTSYIYLRNSTSAITNWDNVMVEEVIDKDYSATQTTEASQPYLTGFIAPNEKWGLKNPNVGSKYMTHPTISFAANGAWSVTDVINATSSTSNGFYSGTTTAIKIDSGLVKFTNASGTVGSFTTDYKPYVGKNTIITLTAVGNGTLKLYINGVYKESISIATNVIFANLLKDPTNYFFGTYSSKFTRGIEMNSVQVAAEATKLRQIFPEIPSVTIVSVNVASSNLEVVASSNGTAIPNVTDNATWAIGNAAWAYHNNDPAIGSLYGKLYNKAARDIIIANPPSGWHVATEVELTSLAANGGNALKYNGTDYWNTTGGTNSTGFTALGASSRNADGTFNAIKDHVAFWCTDSDKVMKLYHNTNVAEVVPVSSVNEGFSIRLVKD